MTGSVGTLATGSHGLLTSPKAKIAESTRVDPYGERCSIVTVESRVCLTVVNGRRRFRRYWLLLGPFMRLMRPTLMRALERRLQ